MFAENNSPLLFLQITRYLWPVWSSPSSVGGESPQGNHRWWSRRQTHMYYVAILARNFMMSSSLPTSLICQVSALINDFLLLLFYLNGKQIQCFKDSIFGHQIHEIIHEYYNSTVDSLHFKQLNCILAKCTLEESVIMNHQQTCQNIWQAHILKKKERKN